MLYHDKDIKIFRTRRRVLSVFFALFFILAALATLRLTYVRKRDIPVVQSINDIRNSLKPVTVVTNREEIPLLLEAADTEEKRSQGLMFRRNLAKNSGMLFVFPGDTHAPFWMKNTLLPLDILFIDAAGRIVDFASMEPCSLDPCPLYASSHPYRYALETSQGFIQTHQIRRGDRVLL